MLRQVQQLTEDRPARGGND